MVLIKSLPKRLDNETRLAPSRDFRVTPRPQGPVKWEEDLFFAQDLRAAIKSPNGIFPPDRPRMQRLGSFANPGVAQPHCLAMFPADVYAAALQHPELTAAVLSVLQRVAYPTLDAIMVHPIGREGVWMSVILHLEQGGQLQPVAFNVNDELPFNAQEQPLGRCTGGMRPTWYAALEKALLKAQAVYPHYFSRGSATLRCARALQALTGVRPQVVHFASQPAPRATGGPPRVPHVSWETAREALLQPHSSGVVLFGAAVGDAPVLQNMPYGIVSVSSDRIELQAPALEGSESHVIGMSLDLLQSIAQSLLVSAAQPTSEEAISLAQVTSCFDALALAGNQALANRLAGAQLLARGKQVRIAIEGKPWATLERLQTNLWKFVEISDMQRPPNLTAPLFALFRAYQSRRDIGIT